MRAYIDSFNLTFLLQGKLRRDDFVETCLGFFMSNSEINRFSRRSRSQEISLLSHWPASEMPIEPDFVLLRYSNYISLGGIWTPAE